MLTSLKSKHVRLSIILASQSPRRQEILRDNLGLQFNVLVSGFAEDIAKESCASPEDYVSRTCRMKAIGVTSELQSMAKVADVVIAADTIVVKDGIILEKPTNTQHAVVMLSSLSGHEHEVMTAVTICINSTNRDLRCIGVLQELGYNANFADNTSRADISALPSAPDNAFLETTNLTSFYLYKTFVTCTRVHFAHLPMAAIEGYVATGEPMDKAGSYGIQGIGSSFISAIHGCYFNVVGFPVHNFAVEFGKVLAALD